MVYVLDTAKLTAAGNRARCNVDTIREVYSGGAEADCPRVVDVQTFADGTSGGPHWGALDNFRRRANGTYVETPTPSRIAVSNYFVARTGVDGDHKVCMLSLSPTGKLSIDRAFRDENEGTPCVSFNRTNWPHGKYGDAKPHSELFVVTDALLH